MHRAFTVPSTANLALAIALAIVGGCTRRVNVAMPVPLAGEEPPIATELSSIPVHVSADLGALTRALNAAVPGRLSSNGCEDVPTLGCAEWFVEREAIDAWVDSAGHVSLGLSGHGGGRVTIGPINAASCGHGDSKPLRLRASVSAQPEWQPDYSLRTNANLTAQLLDRCVVTMFRRDASSLVEGVSNGVLRRLTGTIDHKIAGALDAQSRMNTAWQRMSEPIALGRIHGSDAWLQLRPRGIFSGSLVGHRNTVSAAFGFEVQPLLTMGARPLGPALAPLPPLAPPSTADSAFRIVLQASVPYDTIGAQLTRMLSGTTYRHRVRLLPDPEMTVRHIDVVGRRDTLILGVQVSGSVEGRLLVRGAFEPSPTGSGIVLRLDELDLGDFGGLRGRMLRLAHGLIDRPIRQLLDGRAIDLTHLTERARFLADSALNQTVDGVLDPNAAIERPTLEAIYSREDGIGLVLRANGTLKLALGDFMPRAEPELLWVNVAIHTDNDEKDEEEHVSLELLRDGSEVLAKRAVGHGRTWNDNTEMGPFALPLPAGIPASQCSRLGVRITKSIDGGRNGRRWKLRARISGRATDRPDVYGSGDSGPLDFGDGGGRPVSAIIELSCPRAEAQ